VETPPQFPGAPKKSKTGLILGGLALAVVLCCCGCGGLMMYYGKDIVKTSTGFVGCGMGIQQSRDAMLQYAEKNGGKLPPAKTWQDSIKPYLSKMVTPKSEEMPFKIPGANDDFCDDSANTSISMNAALGGKKLAEVKDQMGTILLFETPNRGRNKSAPWNELPFSSSPKVIMGVSRGWIRQPVKGEAAFKDEKGRLQPISGVNRGGGISVETKMSSGDADR
jgi:hypothetical protein